MSRLLCCLRPRDMGAALSAQEGDGCEGAAPSDRMPTMQDVIRERKKKNGGAGLGTLRRRLARRGRGGTRADRGCEHARYVRSVVGSWRLADVFLLCEQLETLAALRDLATQAELAREPAPALPTALPALLTMGAGGCSDVTLVGAGWSLRAHRAVLAARSPSLRAALLAAPHAARLTLEGAAAALPEPAARAALAALYGAPEPCLCREHEQGGRAAPEGDLDIISSENASSGCTCGRWSRAGVRRLAATLGATSDPLQVSLRYLLESAELADTRLVFRLEPQWPVLELPAHRAVLCARSRVFRSILARRGGVPCAVVAVDEQVLPRRFARALLHAAYTDQVDLSLIGRSSGSPSCPTSGSVTSTWTGVGRCSRLPSTALLDDAFQLYDIARFLEMPIVVQGCEDAVVEALSPDTLAHVLRWAAASHASQWVHRQAMRYLRDEFVTIMSHAAAARLPQHALQHALASPFLQAPEPTILRLVVKWASEAGGAGAGAGAAGARRRGVDADLLAPLLALVRLEHVAPSHVQLAQLVRRGLVSPPAEAGAAAAWLGRGTYREPRAFLPYLDELKALLEEQAVPEAELARARRARYLHRIPDTLYMVAAARGAEPAAAARGALGGAAGAQWWGGARTLRALRARVRELRRSPPALLALQDPRRAHDVTTQICLRAVRERSLPDACAELLMAEPSPSPTSPHDRSRPRSRADCDPWPDDAPGEVSGSLRSHTPGDAARNAGTYRRDGPDAAPRGWPPSGRLSAAVPDVAMAPNANTHLLTPRDYCRHWEYGGVVLQLDLGDGATHTPRPGSRAARNSGAGAGGGAGAGAGRHREYMSCLRVARPDDTELRAAIELSVMRAYSLGGAGAQRASTLPHHPRHSLGEHSSRHPDPPAPAPQPLVGGRSRSPSPVPSPRLRRLHHLHDYRLEGEWREGVSAASTSRGHSPNNYA